MISYFAPNTFQMKSLKLDLSGGFEIRPLPAIR